MRIRVPGYYKEFKCIAAACEDTCCAGWDVVIDDQTYQRYQVLEGAFGDRLRSKMTVDKDGDNIFILDGDQCPFLNDSNLCDIHSEKGVGYLCHTCEQYPRYTDEFGDIKEMGISLSCPEAARIILRHTESSEFEVSEDNHSAKKVHGDEEDILEEFFLCRTNIISIMEMADIALGIRTSMVLRFVQELQDRIDFDELDELSKIRDKYSDISYQKAMIEALSATGHSGESVSKGNEADKYKDVHAYLETYRDLEHINSDDPLGLNKALMTFWTSDSDRTLYTEAHRSFNQYYKDNMVKFEKLFIYFVFRYFMKSFYDYDMSSKIKVAVMSTIMIKELAVVRWMEKGAFTEADMVDISHEYSKDVEHLVENVESLERIFETEEVYSVDRIINTLMNDFK